jgi:Tol biopolymer transport system component
MLQPLRLSTGRLVLLLATAAALVAGLLAGSARSAGDGAGLIAFTRHDGIYVMRADGTGVRPLRRGLVASRAFELDWSPDGRRLAFGTFPDGAIWVMGADGTGLTRVVAPGGTWGSAYSPTWSPDGRRLAYSVESAREIWVVDADGSDAHRLLRMPRSWASGVGMGVGEIDWSPDGRRIALTAHSGWVTWVYVVNTNGTDLRRLTGNARGIPWASDPDWSPNGRRIALVSGKRRPEAEPLARCAGSARGRPHPVRPGRRLLIPRTCTAARSGSRSLPRWGRLPTPSPSSRS